MVVPAHPPALGWAGLVGVADPRFSFRAALTHGLPHGAHGGCPGFRWVSRIPVPTRWVSRIPLIRWVSRIQIGGCPGSVGVPYSRCPVFP